MVAISSAFQALDAEAQRRVLRWAADKYEVKLIDRPARGTRREREDAGDGLPEGPNDVDDHDEVIGGDSEYEDFADLYDAARPTSNADKALVAAYWAQKIKGQKEFRSQSLNNDLKNLGHRIPRINDALATGIKARPALVLQVRKSSNSNQARKTYKLSTEGLRAVERMLATDER